MMSINIIFSMTGLPTTRDFMGISYQRDLTLLRGYAEAKGDLAQSWDSNAWV